MVRPIQETDMPEVKQMMYDLWPDFDGQCDFENEKVFVWEDAGKLGGFVSFSVRPWVEGADIAPCPHIEGWFVAPHLRNKGIGKALIKAVEMWCCEHGYTELTSDVEVQNEMSLSAHEALGFKPTTRIQYFKKKLIA